MGNASIANAVAVQTAWKALRAQYRLVETTFRRDMTRALWWIENSVFGQTLIDRQFASQDQDSQCVASCWIIVGPY